MLRPIEHRMIDGWYTTERKEYGKKQHDRATKVLLLHCRRDNVKGHERYWSQ